MTQPEPPLRRRSERSARAGAAADTTQLASTTDSPATETGFAGILAAHPRACTVVGTPTGPAQAAAAGTAPAPTATSHPARPVPAKVAEATPIRTCTVSA